MVGGLVQQQEVGLGRQRPGQRRPGQLAARERAQLAVEVGGREAESARDRLEPRAPARTRRRGRMPAGRRRTGASPAASVSPAAMRRSSSASSASSRRASAAPAPTYAPSVMSLLERWALVVQGDPRARRSSRSRRRSGCSSPARIRSSVVFPAPFRPTSATRSRGRTMADTSARTSSAPKESATVETCSVTPVSCPRWSGCFPPASAMPCTRGWCATPSSCCARPAPTPRPCAARRAAGSRPGTAGSSPTPAVSPGRPCGRWPIWTPWWCPSGSCTAMIRLHWRKLFYGDRDEALATRIAGRTFELSQYLVEELGVASVGSPTGRRGHLPRLLPHAAGAAPARAAAPASAGRCRAARAAPRRALLRIRRGVLGALSGRLHGDGRRQAGVGGGLGRRDGRERRPGLHHADRGAGGANRCAGSR